MIRLLNTALLIIMLLVLAQCKTQKNIISPILDISNTNESLLSEVKNLNTIAFGSCNKSDEAQPLWDDITATDPDLWIWLGDAIYGDSEDMNVLRKKYNKQKSQPAYKAFSNDTPIIGIWDDHDYGVNNGDSTYPTKAGSRDEFYDFLDIPEDSDFRKREGAYQSYKFSSVVGEVAVILLDTRYFKDPILRKKGVYVLDDNLDILGEEQWKWLEGELSKKADVTIIANGTQVIPKDHKYEKWANYPSSRKRLLTLIEDISSQVILLSGDRHFGEMSQLTLENGKTISEVTSSGMTHTYEALTEETNQHRIGEFTNELNFGTIRFYSDSTVLELRGDDNTVLQSIVIK